MPQEELVHKSLFDFSENVYPISIYRCDGKKYIAKTEFGPGDMVINDGDDLLSLLERHRRLLPLAIMSRQMRPKRQ